ncbi:hypothetical protein SDC9_41770 [bioreactor metagenome]|uniref:Recombinase domain-containing protein n=1 Tax=bioreactor metagenome TaxID=1076179 RepID=A0A644VW44_9ZZZZ
MTVRVPTLPPQKIPLYRKITIMSSLAQEESRSLSENVTWGQRKRFADGKVSMPYARFIGYDKGENNTPQVNEEEAVVVRLIYSLSLKGYTPHTIAKRVRAIYLKILNMITPLLKAHYDK